MGFPRKETNSIFCGVFKSRFKRKVIKNIKEYEQGDWIHAQAACLQPSCADRPSVHSFRLAEKDAESVQHYPFAR